MSEPPVTQLTFWSYLAGAVWSLAWLALLGTSTASQDLRTALRMLLALVMGFVTGIWAPLSIVAVLLGAWRRETERRRATSG